MEAIPTAAPVSPVGFIGLGVMGLPMALNLAQAGTPLVVWNRTAARATAVAEQGAEVVATPGDVFAACDVTILMLADDRAIDAVLAPVLGSGGMRDRTVVQMGTITPEASVALGRRIVAAGGRYVEAPVSGSRVPAENGELVVMLAGDEPACADVARLIEPLCRTTFVCGDVPSALTMKLSVNIFLITLVTGLAESFHFAQRHGVDPALLRDILGAGQMASPISRIKADKLVAADFAVQASIPDVLKNAQLVADAARAASVAVPLIDECVDLYAETLALGLADADMAAVIHAYEHR